jgi:acetyl esterase/lipase
MIKNIFLDITYAGISKTQTLDIYLPDSGKGPFPAIICIHGGGFAFGDNRGAELAIALKALDRGYAVVSVNYRMSGEATYPAAINDVKLDRWLK